MSGWMHPAAGVPIDSYAVELVEHGTSGPGTGIGRYGQSLHRHLQPLVQVQLTSQTFPPLQSRLGFLHYLPTGVAGHRPGSLVHFLEDLACAQMLWRPVRPAVATSHDLGMLAWPPEARMHPAFDRAMLSLGYRGLRRVDAVITVSEFSRQQVIERLGVSPGRVFAVLTGLDHGLFRPVSASRAEVLARHGISAGEDDRYLLYVGSEYPRKNLAAVLRALRRLPESVRLLKVGAAGGDRFRGQTVRQAAELGVRQRVHFLDHVSDAELVSLYSVADTYVCASHLEGFGQPVLEAMACGLPVVSSTGGALPEVAGSAALLIEPSDDRALAEAVSALLDDRSLRGEMVDRGLRQAAKFDWPTTAAAVAEVYRRVLDRSLQA